MAEHENSVAGKEQTQTGIIIAVLVGLPIFYVLSIGPAIILVNKFPSLNAPLEIVYAPMVWMIEKYPAAMELFMRYADFWDNLSP